MGEREDMNMLRPTNIRVCIVKAGQMKQEISQESNKVSTALQSVHCKGQKHRGSGLQWPSETKLNSRVQTTKHQQNSNLCTAMINWNKANTTIIIINS